MSKSFKQEKSYTFKREGRQDNDATFEKFVRPKKQFKKPKTIKRDHQYV